MSTIGTTVQRGYGQAHKNLRAWFKPRVNAGLVACWRCGRLIIPNPAVLGDGWDVGHDDYDRSIIRGPEHAGRCNRAAGARKGNRLRAVSSRRRRSRIW